jgi:hypothetical protein
MRAFEEDVYTPSPIASSPKLLLNELITPSDSCESVTFSSPEVDTNESQFTNLRKLLSMVDIPESSRDSIFSEISRLEDRYAPSRKRERFTQTDKPKRSKSVAVPTAAPESNTLPVAVPENGPPTVKPSTKPISDPALSVYDNAGPSRSIRQLFTEVVSSNSEARCSSAARPTSTKCSLSLNDRLKARLAASNKQEPRSSPTFSFKRIYIRLERCSVSIVKDLLKELGIKDRIPLISFIGKDICELVVHARSYSFISRLLSEADALINNDIVKKLQSDIVLMTRRYEYHHTRLSGLRSNNPIYHHLCLYLASCLERHSATRSN